MHKHLQALNCVHLAKSKPYKPSSPGAIPSRASRRQALRSTGNPRLRAGKKLKVEVRRLGLVLRRALSVLPKRCKGLPSYQLVLRLRPVRVGSFKSSDLVRYANPTTKSSR